LRLRRLQLALDRRIRVGPWEVHVEYAPTPDLALHAYVPPVWATTPCTVARPSPVPLPFAFVVK